MKEYVMRARGTVAVALLAWCTGAGAAPVALGSYDVDTSKTSVSGISSGGYMAQQFHVAYSSLVSGVGVLAGGPYYCAQGNVAIALTTCTTPTALNEPDATYSIHVTDDLAARGEIDPPSGVLNDKVWLFSGAKDETVYPVVMDKLEEYYRHYVNPAIR